MISVEEAQTAILQAIRPAGDSETIALDQTCGRYCAEELRARVDHPAFDNSEMDGYALEFAAARKHGFVLPVVGASSCGDAPGTLHSGSAMRIYTGAPLPAGADTVVIQEDVRVENQRVHLPDAMAVDQHIRRRGEDYRADELLYSPGRRLSAFDLALLGCAGVDRVRVYRRPRALVAATGNELSAPGQALAPGRIYESNRLALAVQLRALGAEVVDAGIIPDDLQALRELLTRAREFDFVVTTGGASAGDHDLVKQAFGEVGTLHLWKVRVKPGKPIAFGRFGERAHFFALPGNPVSTLVTYKLFIEPAVIAWHHGTPRQWLLEGTAVNEFRRQPGRTEFLRARLQVDKGRLMAEALRGQGSHMVGPLRHTNGFIRVEADSPGFAAGDAVNVLPLGF